ncbi:DUF4224 domain-containing protein [Frederiksenia canicola]|uniref:Uncharacterized protein DUF4224 n=1 Tax=Frederiksenia canicola TaxID=123824 RepID=A0AAE6X6K4_9PAST|nr:DUF4224 domain-containing protein [Frederiksenia canicola]QIM65232.1 hypothetical protein A4G17_07180 [Frederiksenia canicola]RPE96340.1 uncharacterized protein DUF4224 [Frederiksenia canicola]
MEFLTPDELAIYTGYERPAEQLKWLEKQKIVPFTINGKGCPVVIYKHVFGFRRDGKDDVSAHPSDPNWQPNPPPPPSRRKH